MRTQPKNANIRDERAIDDILEDFVEDINEGDSEHKSKREPETKEPKEGKIVQQDTMKLEDLPPLTPPPAPSVDNRYEVPTIATAPVRTSKASNSTTSTENQHTNPTQPTKQVPSPKTEEAKQYYWQQMQQSFPHYEQAQPKENENDWGTASNIAGSYLLRHLMLGFIALPVLFIICCVSISSCIAGPSYSTLYHAVSYSTNANKHAVANANANSNTNANNVSAVNTNANADAAYNDAIDEISHEGIESFVVPDNPDDPAGR